MRTLLWGVAAIAFALIAAFAFTRTADGDPIAGSTVRLYADKGHGSAVHIGNGFLVTAAHVVGERDEMSLRTDTGAEGSATVLWANEAHDIALLRTDGARIAISPLTCVTPEATASVRAAGNPGMIEFVTMWGRVSGGVRTVGPWAEVIVLDITVAPGMSGGPLLDAADRVVGIVVGAMLTSVGYMPSPVAISFAVPASTVCNLLARS